MQDTIFIHGLKTEAIIGIFDWERQVKQTVLIDFEICADIRRAASTDSIEDTLNYKRVAKRVLAFVEQSAFHLIETLAEHVAMLVLEEFGGHHGANRVQAKIFRSRRTATVAVEAGQRVAAAWLQWAAQHVELRHRPPL